MKRSRTLFFTSLVYRRFLLASHSRRRGSPLATLKLWRIGSVIQRLWKTILPPSKRRASVLTGFTIPLTLFFLIMVLLPLAPATAAGLVPCGGAGQNPCTICDLGILLMNITNFGIWKISIPVAGLMIVVGGVMILTGAASETRITKGKKVITNAVIGIAIVFLAWLAVDTAIKVMVGDFSKRNFNKTFGPWNSIGATCSLGGGATSAPNADVQGK